MSIPIRWSSCWCILFFTILSDLCNSQEALPTLDNFIDSSTTSLIPSPTRLPDRANYLCSPELQVRDHFPNICLPTVATSPDPLGVSLVSGFYGPGAWVSWNLALMASYVRLYTEPYAKLDPNTWLFLLGTNWASVDFLRRTRGFSKSRHALTDDRRAGAIAASLTEIHWGCWSVLVQLLVVLGVQGYKARPLRQRLVTLLGGSLLPTLSLTIALFSVTMSEPTPALGGVPLSNLPFLYFWGSSTSYLVILTAFTIGALMLLCVVVALSSMLIHICLYDRYKWARKLSDPCGPALRMFGGTVFPLVAVAIFIICAGILCAGIFGNASTADVGMGFKAAWSKSCFYMPCAPQSLLDWDQLYSLVVGLTLLFGIEIAPEIIKRRKEKKQFENSLRRRIDEGWNRRRARETRGRNGDIVRFSNIGMESDDIEMGSLDFEDEEEPDATLDYDTLERAMLYEAFAASENHAGQSEFANEFDDGIGTAIGEEKKVGDELYMMSGALVL